MRLEGNCPICNSTKLEGGTQGCNGSGNGIRRSSTYFTCLNCGSQFSQNEIEKNNNVTITYEIHYNNIKKLRKIKLNKICQKYS